MAHNTASQKRLGLRPNWSRNTCHGSDSTLLADSVSVNHAMSNSAQKMSKLELQYRGASICRISSLCGAGGNYVCASSQLFAVGLPADSDLSGLARIPNRFTISKQGNEMHSVPGSSGSWALPVEILSAMVAGAVLAQDTQDTDLPISATNSRSLPSCKTCLAR